MDPLVASAYKNFTSSPLCRLPDELLLEIMKYLDPVELCCLRRVSRIFLRLFGSWEFRSHQLDKLGPWVREGALAADQQKRLRRLLRRDKQGRYCSACLRRRWFKDKDRTFEYLVGHQLYCSGCKTKHAAGLFSGSQRNRTEDNTRLCIAQQGHLRVCRHRVIRWTDIQRWVAQTSEASPKPYTETLCQERSHLYCCRKRDDTPLRPDGIQLCVTRFSTLTQIQLTWYAHAPSPRGRQSWLLPSANELRQTWEFLQLDGGKLIPLDAYMACFDPNVCSCLIYDGQHKARWPLAPPPFLSCRARSGRRSLFSGSGPVALHTASSGLRTGPVRRGSVFLSIKQCPNYPKGQEMCIYHDYHLVLKAVDSKRPWRADPAWYRMVDPESYGLERDDYSLNLLWCLDKECRNYHGRTDVDRFRDFFKGGF